MPEAKTIWRGFADERSMDEWSTLTGSVKPDRGRCHLEFAWATPILPA
ncbi:MAG: hypothetical protein QGG98_02720 [Pseudomonadales bacterium]|nr:hypothetical protein [Pseudomonadales bacterium]